MSAREFNFDGLVGPTHHYAGLSAGNLASTKSAGRVSHPRRAALQGLAKMAKLHSLGVPQAILPPQPRPDLRWLRRLGFTGDDARVIESAGKQAPRLLSAAYSASSMWTANAATVIPSSDAGDGRVHFMPANLSREIHRSIEVPYTARLLESVFRGEEVFAHHPPLPIPGDEGAANHTRLCAQQGEAGIELFVYGMPAGAEPRPDPSPASEGDPRRPGLYPARQHEEASRAVARLGGIDSNRAIFLQQNPVAIDAGVFHNDVIATGHRDLLFLHADAFVDQANALDEISRAYRGHCGSALRIVEVSRESLPLARAVETYLFNCQLVTRPDGRLAFIGPIECREDAAVRELLRDLCGASGPFDEMHFVDLRESMRNGGGPACLRLRVVLTPDEKDSTHSGVFFDDALHERLRAAVEKHYRDELYAADLEDPALVGEAQAALDAITSVMDLRSVYDFQKE